MNSKPEPSGQSDFEKKMECFVRYSDIDQIIASLPEGTSPEQIVEALKDRGFDATLSNEQGIEVAFEGLGTVKPDPRFIWSQKRLGFYEAANTTTDNMHLNEVENAIDSLEVAAFLLDRTTNLKWKWIVISLHHSFYSYMVAALTGTSPGNVKDWGRKQDNDHILEDSHGIWRSKMVPREDQPDAYTIQWERLPEIPESERKSNRKEAKNVIGFWTALARVMDDRIFMNRFCIDRDCALKLSEDQWQSMIFATKVRNSLIHFSPATHVFDVQSMRMACLDLLDAIEFVAFLPFYIAYGNRVRGRKRVELALAKLRKHCAARTA